MGKHVHFSSKPRHVTPQINQFQKNEPCSEGFNTHLCGCSGDRWENVHCPSKPRHVTPQIDHLRKTNLVLMVPTHISGISKEIDGKMCIFQVKLGM